jgi:hypothetical protein
MPLPDGIRTDLLNRRNAVIHRGTEVTIPPPEDWPDEAPL